MLFRSTNVWAGTNAAPPASDVAALEEWVIALPSAHDVQCAAASVRAAGFACASGEGDAIVVHDPWGTAVRLEVERG